MTTPIRWEVDLVYRFPDTDQRTTTTLIVDAVDGREAIKIAKQRAPSPVLKNLKFVRTFIYPRDAERDA